MVHALGVQRDVLLLPGWAGDVLDYQQRVVDCSTVGYQHPNGRATQVQLPEVQIRATHGRRRQSGHPVSTV